MSLGNITRGIIGKAGARDTKRLLRRLPQAGQECTEEPLERCADQISGLHGHESGIESMSLALARLGIKAIIEGRAM